MRPTTLHGDTQHTILGFIALGPMMDLDFSQQDWLSLQLISEI